jgi:hypothetical protein
MAKSAKWDRPKLSRWDSDSPDARNQNVLQAKVSESRTRRRKEKGVVGKLSGVGATARRRKADAVGRMEGPKGPYSRKGLTK